jgi:hypothetical protein
MAASWRGKRPKADPAWDWPTVDSEGVAAFVVFIVIPIVAVAALAFGFGYVVGDWNAKRPAQVDQITVATVQYPAKCEVLSTAAPMDQDDGKP